MFASECRQELHAALQQGPPRSLPFSFVWGVSNFDWQRRLRKAHRSLMLRIVNLTTRTFLLDKQASNQLVLEEGLWVEVRLS